MKIKKNLKPLTEIEKTLIWKAIKRIESHQDEKFCQICGKSISDPKFYFKRSQLVCWECLVKE